MAIDRPVAERSMLLKNIFEDFGTEGTPETDIPIPNVSSTPHAHAWLRFLTRITQVNEVVLRKVLEWCIQHRGDPAPSNDEESETRKKTTDIDEWDQKFMQVDQEMLFEIILAANYLDIKALLDVGCKTVANMIKGKSPEEIRKTFNIQNDFTPEEEEQIRRENEWAEDR